MSYHTAESLLRSGVEQLDLSLDEGQIQQLLQYLALLGRWNIAYNLTAVREPKEQVVRHLLDSLSILPTIERFALASKGGLTCLDVGTGAGIPGLILAIARPGIRWVLLDSNGKKTRFLVQCCHALVLDNVQVVHDRLENFSPSVHIDIVVSRAFTQLRKMTEWLVHPELQSAKLLAMKGQLPQSEIDELYSPWVVEQTNRIQVPFLDEARHLLVLGRTDSSQLES